MNNLRAFGMALGAYLLIAILWHVLLLPPAPREAGYPYTHILMPSALWTAFLFACIGGGLGWLTGRKWAIAIGLLVSFPVALALEIHQDPTSHNLFPFEILFGWVPLFLVALGAAHLGSKRFR